MLSLGHEFSVGNSLHPPDVGVGKEDTGSPEAGQTTSREGSGVTLPIPEVHWGGEGCKGEVAPAGEPKIPVEMDQSQSKLQGRGRGLQAVSSLATLHFS